MRRAVSTTRPGWSLDVPAPGTGDRGGRCAQLGLRGGNRTRLQITAHSARYFLAEEKDQIAAIPSGFMASVRFQVFLHFIASDAAYLFQPLPAALATRARPRAPVSSQLYHLAVLRRAQCNLKNRVKRWGLLSETHSEEHGTTARDTQVDGRIKLLHLQKLPPGGMDAELWAAASAQRRVAPGLGCWI